jgi:hypothetical protein
MGTWRTHAGGAVDLQFDEARNIAHIKLAGELSERVILDAFDAAVSHTEYRNGMGRLWDFRDADLSSLDAATVIRMTKYSAEFRPGIRDVKVAFVATAPLEYGLARMFEAHSENADAQVRVFITIEEAVTWLTG